MANKKTMWGVGLTVAGLAAWFFSKGQTVKEGLRFLDYQISDLKFQVRNILNPEIIFTISVYNPNSVPVPVTDFFGQITRGTTVLASFQNIDPVSFEGRQQKNIQVTARLKALGIVTELLKLLQKDKTPVLVEGILKTGYFDMSVRKVVNLGLMTAISGDEDDIGRLKKKRKHKKGFRLKRFLQPHRIFNKTSGTPN